MSKGNAGGDLRRFYIIFAVVAAVGLGAVAYSVGSNAFSQAVSEPVELEGSDDLRQLADMAIPVVIGEEDAPVTIIIFEDYLCNHCAAFSLQEKPRVVEELIETGKARLLYYDYPLNPQLGSFIAARAARCAGDQDRFWDYHNILMRNQMTWGMEANQISSFEEYAETLGMDTGDFKGCLNSDQHAASISANLELARNLGLPGTPTVLIGSGDGMSRRLPDYYFETIQDAVEAILAGG
jgi:protein-disulfide isomerase